MRLLFFERMVQVRTKEGLLVLWIGHSFLPPEGGELFAAPTAHRFDQRRISMAREVLKRCCLSVFFTHENQRREGRQQSDSGCEFESFERHQT